MDSGSGGRADDDALLADYLLQVRRAARRLPRARREWVIGRAGDHIAAALDADDEAPSGAGVLVRLGDPRHLVQAVDGHVPGDEARWADHLAVLLLVIGGLAFLPGWAGGVVLLWASPRWQLRERLIGTLIWPGGLAGFWFLVVRSSLPQTFRMWWYSYPSLSNQPFLSTASYRPSPVFWLTLVALSAAQIAAGIWLLRRARSPELAYPWDSVTARGGERDLS